MQNLDSTIRLCQEGDSEAWKALVEHFQRRIYAVCLYYVRNREDAVDASQEVFVKVFKKLDGFSGDTDAFLSWLLSIARNTCIDRIRAREKRTEYQSEYQHTVSDVDATQNPEKELERDQQQNLLYRALSRFSELNRDVILLKDIQGLRLEEVAQILNLPVGTIKSRSNRARVKLGKILAELKP